MPRDRSDTEKAAGRLTAAIQKEWMAALGDNDSDVSFEIMEKGSALLGAASSGTLLKELKGRSVARYIGSIWLNLHPAVVPFVEGLESAIEEQSGG